MIRHWSYFFTFLPKCFIDKARFYLVVWAHSKLVKALTIIGIRYINKKIAIGFFGVFFIEKTDEIHQIYNS